MLNAPPDWGMIVHHSTMANIEEVLDTVNSSQVALHRVWLHKQWREKESQKREKEGLRREKRVFEVE